MAVWGGESNDTQIIVYNKAIRLTTENDFFFLKCYHLSWFSSRTIDVNKDG